MVYLSILCLVVIVLSCLIRIFDQKYNDTLLERVGLSLLSMWAISGLFRYVEYPELYLGDYLILHLGVASLSVNALVSKKRLSDSWVSQSLSRLSCRKR